MPFLKVDKGLAAEVDGAQLMKPIDGLDELLKRAVDKGVFGTKMRSVIMSADPAGVAGIVAQQFEVGGQILDAGLVPIIEPEVDIHSATKAEAETLLKAAIAEHLGGLGDRKVMLKLTPARRSTASTATSSPTRTCCAWSPCPAATPATRPTRSCRATPA